MDLQQKLQRGTAPHCTNMSLYRNFVLNLTNVGDLPLHTAVWTLALHFPELVHLTSSLTPDKMNPRRQLRWHVIPGLAGCLPQLGGERRTPLGFWKVGQWRSIAAKWKAVTCIPTNFKKNMVMLPWNWHKSLNDICLWHWTYDTL